MYAIIVYNFIFLGTQYEFEHCLKQPILYHIIALFCNVLYYTILYYTVLYIAVL